MFLVLEKKSHPRKSEKPIRTIYETKGDALVRHL